MATIVFGWNLSSNMALNASRTYSSAECSHVCDIKSLTPSLSTAGEIPLNFVSGQRRWFAGMQPPLALIQGQFTLNFLVGANVPLYIGNVLIMHNHKCQGLIR